MDFRPTFGRWIFDSFASNFQILGKRSKILGTTYLVPENDPRTIPKQYICIYVYI